MMLWWLCTLMFVAAAQAAPEQPPDLGEAEAQLAALAEEPAVDMTRESLPLSADEAVHLALRNNYGIRIAGLQRVADRFALYFSRDRYTPHVDLRVFAGPTYGLGKSGTGGPLGAEISVVPHAEWILPTGTMFTADLVQNYQASPLQRSDDSTLTLGIMQPLLKNFGTAANLATAHMATWQEGVNRLTFKSTLLRTVSEVTYAYRAFTQASLLRSIAQKAVERASQVLDNNHQMVAAGRIARADLVQVESEIATREANLANAETSFVGFQVALLELLALGPDAPIAPIRETSINKLTFSAEQARAVALQNRPDYAAGLLTQQVAEQALVIARNNRRWDLSLLAQYRRGGPSERPLNVFYNDLPRAQQSVFLGASLTVPLIDLVLEQQIVIRQVAADQARVNVAALNNGIRLDVDGAMRTVRLQQRVYKLSARARHLAAKNLENEQEKLTAGRSSTFVVLRFVDDLVNAEIAEIRAQIAFLNAITAVETQTGTLLNRYNIAIH